MKTIAVIPARGGSKRIPNKNLIDFEGKPLIVWTIEAALQASIFDRIVVSTDSPDIAKVARDAGIEVPFLRKEASDDHSIVSLATISALSQSSGYWEEEYETVVQLMANCPLRTSSDIIAANKQFIESAASFQISCFMFGFMNAWWAAKLDSNNRPEYLHPEAIKARSQDLPDLYCPTGAIWIAKSKELLKSNTFYGDGHSFCPMDWKSAIDIDNYSDLELAKAVFQLQTQK